METLIVWYWKLRAEVDWFRYRYPAYVRRSI